MNRQDATGRCTTMKRSLLAVLICSAHDAADARFVMGMMRFVDRVQRRAPS